jgi:signal transduction histidine kinase
MRTFPVRLRLTLAFAAVMAVVLTAAGLFVYERSRANLDRGVAKALRARAADIGVLAQQSDSGLTEARDDGVAAQRAEVAQILDPGGQVIDQTRGLARRPLVPEADLATARRGRATLRDAPLPGGEPGRLLAMRVRGQDHALVVVVGEPLADRNAALSDLRGVLLVGGPVTLLLASLAGFALTGAALRPIHAMVERIRASAARERTFVADASHELRTPLAMVRTELELIARDQPAGEELERAARSAIEEADRLTRLTDELLLLTRADHGHSVLSPRPSDVAELLDSAAARGRRRVQGDRIRIDVATGATAEAVVSADPERIGQALDNLVDNALRYAERGVELSAAPVDGAIELHVTDDGSGFPPLFLPHAWERFARADAGRTEGGSGLGLAIVRTIAEQHGGAAGARNRAAGGADVWITVPRFIPGSSTHPTLTART